MTPFDTFITQDIRSLLWVFLLSFGMVLVVLSPIVVWKGVSGLMGDSTAGNLVGVIAAIVAAILFYKFALPGIYMELYMHFCTAPRPNW